MHALRVGEDAAVEDGADGAEDAVQRLRREVQVGEAGAGVQAGGEPDVRADAALELSPEGSGAAAAEGSAPPAAAAGGVWAPFQGMLTSPISFIDVDFQFSMMNEFKRVGVLDFIAFHSMRSINQSINFYQLI